VSKWSLQKYLSRGTGAKKTLDFFTCRGGISSEFDGAFISPVDSRISVPFIALVLAVYGSEAFLRKGRIGGFLEETRG